MSSATDLVDVEGGTTAVRATLHDLALRYVAVRVARRELAAGNAGNVRWILIGFAAMCPSDPRLVRRQHVDAWCAAQRVARSTLRTRLSAVRTFCRWLVLDGHARSDPTVGVDGPRNVRHLPRALAHDRLCTTSRLVGAPLVRPLAGGSAASEASLDMPGRS